MRSAEVFPLSSPVDLSRRRVRPYSIAGIGSLKDWCWGSSLKRRRRPAQTSFPDSGARCKGRSLVAGPKNKRGSASRVLGKSPFRKLLDGGEQQRQILGARQPVIAVGDLDHAGKATIEEAHQFARVCRRHGVVAATLQDHHGTARIERRARQEVIAPFLDQRPRDRV